MAHAAPGPASSTPPSARIRALWAAFERALPPAQRTMQHKTLAAHAAADHAYTLLPPAARPSPAQHAANKAAKARELAQAHYDRAVEDWHARLAGAGLAAEMWTDITPEEMGRVARALGAEENGEHISSPPVQAPSLNIATRGVNASSASWHSTASSASGTSYALVKPSEIYSEDEDDAYFAPHTPSHSHSEPASPAMSFHSAPASASDNDADCDDDDAPGTGRRDPFAPWADNDTHAWNTHSRRTTLTVPYASASGSTSASAAASVASLASTSAQVPQAPHHHSHNHNHHEYNAHAFTPPTHANGHAQRTASSSSASSAHSQSHSTSHSTSHSRSSSQLPARVAQPYIGPWLLTTDDDEADPPPPSGNSRAAINARGDVPVSEADAEAAAAFDRFKLETRMRMIVEFHAAAAAAEIKLAGEIWRMRRGLPVSTAASGAGAEEKIGTEKGKSKTLGKEADATPRKSAPPAKGKAKQAQARRGFFGNDEDEDDTSARSDNPHSDDDAHSGDEAEKPATPAALVLAHQSAMAALQAAKEAERREVVRVERDRRRASLREAGGAMNGAENQRAEKDRDTGGKREKEKERRKGRSGTLISGQPATASPPAGAASVPALQAEGDSEEPWLAAAWRAAHGGGGEGAVDGKGGGGGDAGQEEALTRALGPRFELGAVLGGGVDSFLDGVLPPPPSVKDARDGWKREAQATQQHHTQKSQPQAQTQQQQHTTWGAQQTPTATSFGAPAPPPGHRRRASTSASASAAMAASASASVAANANGSGIMATQAFRRVHAPIPVRAAPFGDASASASSSDEEGGGLARRWGPAGQGREAGAGTGYAQGQGTGQSNPQPQFVSYSQLQQATYAPAPPLHALERELNADLMAAFVEYSSLGGGAGAVPLGGANVSSGSNVSGSSSSSSGPGHGAYGYGYSNNSSTFGGSSSNNSGMFGAPSNNHSSSSMFGASGTAGTHNPFASSTSAFDAIEREASRGAGGGPSAFAGAAEALLHSVGGTPDVFGSTTAPGGGAPMRGRPPTAAIADIEAGYGWGAAERSATHSRGASASGHAPAARSRSPTMTRALPSWAARMAGGAHAQEQQQQPAQPQVKETPARGTTATPVASGWTRKFQKPSAGTGTPQPQAAGPPLSSSAMFALKNAFGFADDAEPVAPLAQAPAPTQPMASSWLGGKGKKAAAAVVQSPPSPPHEPEVSLWEQVTQQKAKAGLVAPGATTGSGMTTGKKAVPAVPSPPPPPPKAEKEKEIERVVEKEKPVEKAPPAPPAGKKPNKKLRQAATKKGGKAGFDDPPEPEPAEPEPEPVPPPAPPAASANGKWKFAPQAPVPDEDANDEENGDANEDNDMFSVPSKARGGQLAGTAGRRRLDSLSASGGWDAEGGSASTPRPAPKVPAHLQDLAAAMSAPPPFGLKPLINGAAQAQQQGERPGTGLGMNTSTIRARGGSAAAPAWGAAAGANGASGAQSGGGGTGRSLWGLFGGGSGDAAPKQQVDAWGVPGAYGAAEEAEADADDDGGGGDEGGDDDWTPISRGSAPVEKPQAPPAPAPLAQRLRRGSEAAAPSSPAPRVVGKTAAPAPQPPTSKVAAAAALTKKGKKAAKGKKVTIEDVPDEETDNKGETLPVDSRHIFDDAEPSLILEPKPSVPPGTYDSIISYTDEENERKSAQASARAPAADGWGDDTWMEAAAKEIKEAAAKNDKAASTGGGTWGVGGNAAKNTWGPSAAQAPEEAEEEQSSPFLSALGGGGRAAKGGTPQAASAGGIWGQVSGKDKGKGKGGDEAVKTTGKAAGKRNKR